MRRVVIAGDGIAGSLIACELRARGFAVWLLSVQRTLRGRVAPRRGSMESIPSEASSALDALGLTTVLSRARAVTTSGFENAWDGASMRVHGGEWLTVDREALARELRAEAIARGAEHVTVERLPRLSAASGPFAWTAAGLPERARFAVDATGRAAAWSRPLIRTEARVATLYRGTASLVARRGRIARLPNGWAYALFHPEATTVGVVQPRWCGATAGTLSEEVARALELPANGSFVFERRCAAHAQWAAHPMLATAERAVLAVGDAAFAYEPLAGQGVRFAIASASAAAAVIATQHAHPECDSVFAATQAYYDEFVAGARRRHLASRSAEVDRRKRDIGPLMSSSQLRFEAVVVATGLRRGSMILEESAIRLPDGGLVRWLGAFDLLDLRTLVGRGTTAGEAAVRLQARGMTSIAADGVIRWSLERGLLGQIADS